jgi:MarR family transcriptional regulator, organic hydroperoxide resistance regulator
MKLKLSLFPRSESPGFLIYQTATRLKVGLRRAFRLEGVDVTPEQWTVLNSLWETDGVHQGLLAEKTAKDRHNIARILNLLKKGGLVRREPDGNDKRWRRVYLTNDGWALKPKLVRVSMHFLEEALAGLTQEDLDVMRQILERIADNLGYNAKNTPSRSGSQRPVRERSAANKKQNIVAKSES